jgi:protection-of-telomeres protein 1
VESKSTPPSSYKPGDQPPLDSDDEQENENEGKNSKSRSFQSTTALSEREPNAGIRGLENTRSDLKASAQLNFSNKAFTCCIKQYGAKVNESDPSLANAGDGKRWERKFGLFGTKIL